MKENMS